MNEKTMQSADYDLSAMLGLFLRDHTTSAKQLARLINCDPRTAEGFRAGRYWPSARHWQLIARQFGRDALSVFDADIDGPLARLTAEERQLRERLHEIQARLQAGSSVAVGRQERRVTDLDRDPMSRDLFEAD